MAEAVRDDRWDHTARIVQTLLNANAKRGQQITHSDCHPFRRQQAKPFSEIKHRLINNNGS